MVRKQKKASTKKRHKARARASSRPDGSTAAAAKRQPVAAKKPVRKRRAVRRLDVPGDLAAAIAADEGAITRWNELAPSHRNEWVTWVQEAKRDATRLARIDQAVDRLKAEG